MRVKYIIIVPLIIFELAAYSLCVESFYSLSAVDIHGKNIQFDRYKGKVVLVVNVASECGFTDSHYKALPRLYELLAKYGPFTVLGFPCNQFGAQEPGSNKDILHFVQENYGVTFPMFSKIDVHGKRQHPLYTFLQDRSGQVPNWNFWKFLINHKGEVLYSWGHWQDVEEITPLIKSAINDASKDAAIKPPPPMSDKNIRYASEPQPPEGARAPGSPRPPQPAAPRTDKHAKPPPSAQSHAPKTHNHDDL